MVTVTRLPSAIKSRYQRVSKRVQPHWMSERSLRRRFRETTGYDVDLDDARTLTEKVMRRMIILSRTRDESLTGYVDKFLAREFIADRVGERYLVPLYWHGTDPDQIPFADLPHPCVLKSNHNSGGVAVITADSDPPELRRLARRWLREDYYRAGWEYQYHRIKRRLMVEEFLDDGMPEGPLDYRFWCFHGEPAVIQVDNHSHSINPFYDQAWNALDLRTRPELPEVDIPAPPRLEEMLEVARALSADFDFVRVDLYSVRGRSYVGELTFTPAAGRFQIMPPEWDLRLGEKWRS